MPRPEMSIELLDARGSDIVQARNAAAEMALERESTHLFFLDSDMKFPKETLHRLLAHGKPVVGASYIRRCQPYDLLGKLTEDFSDKTLIEAESLPTGCLLINTTVFKKLSWPYFSFEYFPGSKTRTGEDLVFCRNVRNAGVKIWCDTGLTKEISHVGVNQFRYQT